TISVDTTTPTLSLSISGTKGNNNYYISKPKITATTFDATSGIAFVQAKIDNGNWIDANEITIEDGIHTYQFRAYDNAGNMTETPVQNIKVDTTPPSVEADTKINLGDTLFYTLEDKGSGLAIERIVIEDEDEKYKKIVWLQEISGNKIEGDILWDGKFPSNTLGTSADKTVAGVGEYFITFKISDRAGNETFYTTIVNVNPISYLQSIPEFIIPESVETSNESASNEETGE
ncbi:MAG: Ig-like domain repeat protein, partial [Anaerolineales bacterium]|nr:Ig-like domain repeat protein [Anaerolineales bacterium]